MRTVDPGGFRKLVAATAVSRLGDGLHLTALPLLIAGVAPDPTAFAGMAVAQALPWLLVSLPAGALVDRLDRRLVMTVSAALQCLLAAVLAAAATAGGLQLPTVYALAFALGCCQTFAENAATALLPQLVPADALPTANGRLVGAEIVTGQLIAVPLAGVVFVVSPGLPFLLDALTFALAFLVLLSLRGGRATGEVARAASASTLRREIREGLRWLAADPACRSLAAVGGVINTVITGCFATFALFTVEVLHTGEVGYGLLMWASAAGGAAAGLAAGSARRRLRHRPLLLLSLWVPAVASLAIGLSGNVVVTAAMLALVGFGGTTWTVVTLSLRQSVIPRHFQGRVMSVFRLLSAGTALIGAVLGAMLVDHFGLRAPWLVGAAILLLAPGLAGPALAAVPTGEGPAGDRKSADPAA
ncbi:MFS transporter [Streptomyces malaysiensis]|uniref:MFS transporter n=1 Tax=Streptomyces malaysiensis TaxID=92644 RepID=UPI0033D89C0C